MSRPQQLNFDWDHAPRDATGDPAGAAPISPRGCSKHRVGPRSFAIGFVNWCIQNGIIGAKDLRHLAILSYEFAEYTDVVALTEQGLARQLTRLGIGKGRRKMRPYERGFRAATRDRGIRLPKLDFFVMPQRWPIVPEEEDGAAGPAQPDLF